MTIFVSYDYSVSAKNALHAALDDYFPELHEIFWAMGTRSLWAILERCPFPNDVASMKISHLQELTAKSSRKKAGFAQKARALYQAARKSIGLKRVGDADRFKVKICLEEVKRTVLMLKGITARQIVKYAGYDPQESDSGSWASRKFISKKGRWPMRKCLFFMSMGVVVLSK